MEIKYNISLEYCEIDEKLTSQDFRMISCDSEVERLTLRCLKLDGLGAAGSANSSPALSLWISKHDCLDANNLLI